MNNRPVTGITIGDFNGIGPEIIVKSLCDTKILKVCTPVLIGSKAVFEKISKTLKKKIIFNDITNIKQIQIEKGTINIFNIIDIKPEEII